MSEMESGISQKAKSKKKKSKKAKNIDAPEVGNSNKSVEKLHNLKQSLPECSVTVTEINKDTDGKNKGVKTAKGEVYSLSTFQEKILASSGSGKNDSKPEEPEKAEIELNKLPEITVIRTDPVKSGDKSQEDVPNKQLPANSEENTKSLQKKKNKKKKKKSQSICESSEPENNNNNNESSVPAEPTYVKLPSTGDACVLVVSHENFSAPDNGLKGNSEDITLKNIADLSNKCSNLPQDASPSSAAPVQDIEQSKGQEMAMTKQQQSAAKSGKTMPQVPVGDDASQTKQDTSGTKKQKQQQNNRGAPLFNDNTKVKTGKADSKKPSQNKSSPSNLLFSHLPSYKPINLLQKHLSDPDMPAGIATVGIQALEGMISGSDARCISVLAALEEIIREYATPLNKELSRDLEAQCQTYVSSIGKFRPLSVSIVNAIKFLKLQITNIPASKSDNDAKNDLISAIRKFVLEEILLAKKGICEKASSKVVDGDVILTYAYSDVVKDLLCEAHMQGKEFKVIVVDSKPKLEGKEMLRCLVKNKIKCSYMLISGISYVMKEVSKVFIGADSLLANGYVMSKIGTSQIALIASAYNVPFLVCCETYKFCERVHTDSFDYNEVGSSDSFDIDLKDIGDTDKDQVNSLTNLRLLNVLYDITPPTLVSMVITEKGVLPCTSVPVVLRVRHSGMQE